MPASKMAGVLTPGKRITVILHEKPEANRRLAPYRENRGKSQVVPISIQGKQKVKIWLQKKAIDYIKLLIAIHYRLCYNSNDYKNALI